MMGRLDFCSKWTRWIKGCLESSYVFVLVNGSPIDEFRLENFNINILELLRILNHKKKVV